MKTSTRKVLDKSFTLTSYASLALMCLVIVLFLAPIIVNGIGAVVFSLFGYFYVKHEGRGKLVSSLVPRVAKGEDEE